MLQGVRSCSGGGCGVMSETALRHEEEVVEVLGHGETWRVKKRRRLCIGIGKRIIRIRV